MVSVDGEVVSRDSRASGQRSQPPYALLMRIGLLLIYLIVTAVAAFIVHHRVRERIATSELLPDFTISRLPDGESPNVERVEGQALPVWKGTDRVTVLVLGIDEREQEDDVWRTDTMILATLDPVTMRAGVLSIPRDLWVSIPGYTENRINTAHALGDGYRHPGGGPALAVETVEFNLGVEIDYFVRVNFQAFVDMVDLIGGIDIEVPERIYDYCYPTADYGCEELTIEAGEHHFYGDMALKYARVRRTAGGDFDRSRRQQQVIDAILDRVTDQRLLPQLAARAPEIWQIVEGSVKVDPAFQLDEMIALANLATKVAPEDRHFYAIDESSTLPAETPDRAQILIPLRDRIREIRDEFLGLTKQSSELHTAEEEAATIAVLNGTTVPGLAYAAVEFLQANGIRITHYDTADRQDYATSLIILNRDKPMTAQYLLAKLGLPESAVVHGANPTADYDVVVLLGADYIEDEGLAPEAGTEE
jgi:polyisoprenyl-teichoic acid--peptidoglycan teichoic acid transferase